MIKKMRIPIEIELSIYRLHQYLALVTTPETTDEFMYVKELFAGINYMNVGKCNADIVADELYIHEFKKETR